MDKRLKQRLLGAGVLVALAVIIVPELIKAPEDRNNPVAVIQVPPRSDESGVTISLPPPEDVIATDFEEPEPTDSVVAELEVEAEPEPEPVQSEMLVDNEEPAELPGATPPPIVSLTTEPEPKPEPKPVQPAPPPKPVAKPAKPEPSPKPVAKAAKPKPPPKPEPKPAKPKPPPKPKPKAAKPKDKPKPAPKPAQPRKAEKPKIVLPKIELIGRASPPTAPTTQSPSRWMVQAGSFALEQNATVMRDRLRSRQFGATVQRVLVDGRVLYRVRIGPQSSRSQSEQVRAKLLRETGINGNVVPLN